MADTRLLVGLCLSLLISSLTISIVTGTGAASLGDVGGPVNLDIDFENVTNEWTNHIIIKIGEWKVIDGALTSQSSLPNRFYLDIVGKPTGIFTNTYHIESNGKPYSIIIRETGWYADSVYLTVYPTHVNLESGTLVTYQPFKKHFPVAIPENAVITVNFDEENFLVSVSVNGREIIHNEKVPEDSIMSWGRIYYGGIIADGPGLKVYNIVSNGQVYVEQSFSPLDFIASLTSVMVWYTSSGEPIVDAFINLIIKIQQFGIVAIVITFLRGN